MKKEKVRIFNQLKRKTKQKENLSDSSFQQTEKVQTFYKLNVIFETENQTEGEIFQFKFSTNGESSDFLQIETENLTER